MIYTCARHIRAIIPDRTFPPDKGHKDVPGNEQADKLAKVAASRRSPSETPEVLAATSLAYIARAGTEAERQDRDRWLPKHCRPKSYYTPPRGNKAAFKTRKALGNYGIDTSGKWTTRLRDELDATLAQGMSPSTRH
ncbi:hypothetical protein FN846DRAFT_902127 [Sphaerosporella brunnea]|uniref:RNase H type-1 domain-containing protein n=1 Tax=Sphaerosporella brunnea TaxID=1250544 RepID=A0A5J5FB45_9PEZI|nr:hypothetical protein FN846DRAFT_902127 [Sphaerosporella brunnea]